jgi:RHH-type transcriptional regulator, rel operon repressor / antitoxin RelB
MKGFSVTISIRLTDDEEDRLDRLARRTGRSKSFYVRTALHEHLADMEDAFAADESLDAFEAAGRRTRPLSALKSDLDL